VHDIVFALFLGCWVPSIRLALPGSHLARFCQSLHSHVLVSPSLRLDRIKRVSVIIEGLADVKDGLRFMVLCRSLATGSTSHKTVKSDVSRILWYYYNDNVGPPLLRF
jgi:hypothetical protein